MATERYQFTYRVVSVKRSGSLEVTAGSFVEALAKAIALTGDSSVELDLKTVKEQAHATSQETRRPERHTDQTTR